MSRWRAVLRRLGGAAPNDPRIFSALAAKVADAADLREADAAVAEAVVQRAGARWARVVRADQPTAVTRELLASMPLRLRGVVEIAGLNAGDGLRKTASALDARLLVALRGVEGTALAVLLVGPRSGGVSYTREALDLVDIAGGMLSLRYLNSDLARTLEERHAVSSTLLDTITTIAAVVGIRGGVVVHANHLASVLLSASGAGLIDAPVSSLPTELATALDLSRGEATPVREIAISVYGVVVSCRLMITPLPDYADLRNKGAILAILLPTCSTTRVHDRGPATDSPYAREEVDGIVDALHGVIEALQNVRPSVLGDISGATRALDRALSIVDHLIAATAGREGLGMFDVDAVIRTIISRWRDRLSERRIDVHLDVETGRPRVFGDTASIGEVFQRLLENSVAAMPTGGSINIRVRTTRSDDEEYVSIEVQDAGCGIPSAFAERVFEPLVSLTGRLGMGLAVCRQIVAIHGGRIWALPDARVGATIKMDLPVRRTKLPGKEPTD